VEAVATLPEADSFADGGFSDPRLAALYDPLDPARSDLDSYAAIAAELGAGSVRDVGCGTGTFACLLAGRGLRVTGVAPAAAAVASARGASAVLDVGCGTGTFACLLAGRGLQVTGADPAAASVDVARGKPGAEAVTWLVGDATTLPPMQVDLATMTANVAQVFTTDAAWEATLTGVRRALRPGGHLVFETRIPEVRAWERWNKEHTFSSVDVPGTGRVETWNELLDVRGELVTFRGVVHLVDEDVTIPSVSTLRFRSREQIEASLSRCGFEVVEVGDAADRPGREWVFVARRAG